MFVSERIFPALQYTIVFVVSCLAFHFIARHSHVSWSPYRCRRRSMFILAKEDSILGNLPYTGPHPAAPSRPVFLILSLSPV